MGYGYGYGHFIHAKQGRRDLIPWRLYGRLDEGSKDIISHNSRQHISFKSVNQSLTVMTAINSTIQFHFDCRISFSLCAYAGLC
jgi:hypothetical protein